MKRLILLTVALTAFAHIGWTEDVNKLPNVDTSVKVSDYEDPNTFAVIISNEHYKHEAAVPFALNDGAIFKRYLMKTLGIPEQNIKYVPDASLNDMNYNLSWLEKVVKVKKQQARAIVYYSGHGMPDEDSKKAYLLPVDGYSTEPTSGLSTEVLYKRLGAMPASQTLVFLDACFSGSKREGGMMKSARGVAIKAKSSPVEGMFTFFLLAKLLESGGAVTLGELSDYVSENVAGTSIVINEKSQTPTVTAPLGSSEWRNWKMAENAATKLEAMPKFVPTAQATTAPSAQPEKPAQKHNGFTVLKRKPKSTTENNSGNE